MLLPQIALTDDPLQWLKERSSDFPTMTSIARDFIGIPATSVNCEQQFSHAGNIMSIKRTRMSPELVRASVMLYENREFVPELKELAAVVSSRTASRQPSLTLSLPASTPATASAPFQSSASSTMSSSSSSSLSSPSSSSSSSSSLFSATTTTAKRKYAAETKKDNVIVDEPETEESDYDFSQSAPVLVRNYLPISSSRASRSQ